jgi:hypothetical protein
MSREILFVGGSKHGQTIEIKSEPNFRYFEPTEEQDGFTTYIVCQSGDGKFYAVFEPSDNDPSIRKTNAMRAILRTALGE